MLVYLQNIRYLKLSTIQIFKRYNSLGTIFALSSGSGKCGVAVIRISGSESKSVLTKIGHFKNLPPPRTALLRRLYDPFTNDILDRGLILWFPAPNSFTGEDSCELHIHGGPAVISAFLSTLGKLPKLRPADSGEFTKRAFFAGKIDLTEVEGLADLLEAETEIQRKQAILQTERHIRNLYEKWHNQILNCLANIEAHIDFDETDILEEGIMDKSMSDIKTMSSEIQKHLCNACKGERIKDGVRTVIIGEPNVGKSSLLNLLCDRSAAIVTPIAGTTRDLLQINLDIGGYPISLTDTAGLRSDVDDVIEIEGINRAKVCAKRSDLILLLIDSTYFIRKQLSFEEFFNHYVQKLELSDIIPKFEIVNKNDFNINVDGENKILLIVFNKIDTLTEEQLMEIQKITMISNHVEFISCINKNGFEQLTKKVLQKVIDLCGSPSAENLVLSQVRHKQYLTNCVDYLNRSIDSNNDVVLMAHSLHRALHHLGCITGRVTTNQLLDIIFKTFCIGK